MASCSLIEMTATPQEPELHPIPVLFFDHIALMSGGERSLLDMMRGLDRSRYRAELALPEEGPLAVAAREAGLKVHLLPFPESLRRVPRWGGLLGGLRIGHLIATLRASRSLAKLICRRRIRIVHTNSMKAHVIACMARLWSRFRLVWHVRDIIQSAGLRSVIGLLALQFPDRILCISQAVARSIPFIDSWRAGERIVIIHNGIEAQPRNSRDQIRAEWGVPKATRLIGMVGQIARWKGQHVFVEAARLVLEQRPDCVFVIVGRVMFEENESEFFEKIERELRDGGLEGRIQLKGFHQDPIAVMAALDILVHASIEAEPFGRVLIEAMSQACPVIASRLGGPSEILVDGVSGILVDPNNADLLASRIMNLLDEPRWAQSLGIAGRDRFQARFTLHRLIDEVETVYSDLLRPPDGAGSGKRATQEAVIR